MKQVVAHFILYPQQYQYCAAHAYCQAENIDSRKTFISKKVAESDFQIVFEHIISI